MGKCVRCDNEYITPVINGVGDLTHDASIRLEGYCCYSCKHADLTEMFEKSEKSENNV